jgi:non-heme chloroperoxidase
MKLPYVEHGDPAGVPLLLLHGFTDSWRSWEPVLGHLPSGYRAIAPTQRGHGDAEQPPSGYRIEDFAADAVELMEELELGPAVVAGHSMGAWVAQRIAIDQRERVTGLLLESAFGTTRENPSVVEFGEEVAQLTDPVDRAFVREFQLSTCERPLPAGMLDAIVAESVKLPARVWRDTYAGFLEIDYSEELAEIQAPVLLIWGDRDAFAGRAEQDWLVDRIPDARLAVYEGTGHAVHWEEPERFTRDLAAFARLIEGSPIG